MRLNFYRVPNATETPRIDPKELCKLVFSNVTYVFLQHVLKKHVSKGRKKRKHETVIQKRLLILTKINEDF